MRWLLLAAALLALPAEAQVHRTFTLTASGNPVTVALVASRTTGAAPLGVMFDLTGSTATGVTYPYHELSYSCNFGDPASGAAWSYGTRTASGSKNLGYGPVQAHVFESAGGYDVVCSVTDGTNTQTKSVAITVTAADTQWSGTNTLCVRPPGGSYTGCPAGADQTESADFDAIINATAGSGATYKRILFECDGTYTNSTYSEITSAGPGYIGAYPAGCAARAKPIITGAFGKVRFGNSSSRAEMADWRVVDLNFDGVSNPGGGQYGIATGGPMSQLTVLRNTFANLEAGMFNQLSTLDNINVSSSVVPVWNQWIFAENSFDAGTTTRFQGAMTNSAFIGNQIVNLVSGHAMRMVYVQKFVVTNNDLTGTASGAALTIRGLRWVPSERQSISPTQGGNQYTVPAGDASYTQQIVAAENKLTALDNAATFSVHAVTVTDDVRFRNVLVEGNWILANGVSTSLINVESSLTTIRNNICDYSTSTSGANICVGLQANGGPVADSIWIYNNSLYSTLTTGTFPALVLSTGGAQTNVVVKNNAAHSPNNTDDETGPVRNSGSASITASHNSTKEQMQAATSPFVDSTPAAPGDYDAANEAAHDAVDTGTAVPVWRDFFQVLRTGTYDMGAVLP